MYKIVSKESPEELEKEVITLVQQGWMPVGSMVPTYKLVKTSRRRESVSTQINKGESGQQQKTQTVYDDYQVEYTYHQTLTKKVAEVHSTVDIISGCVCNCGGGGD